jgi:hypothetical protein
MKSMTVVEEFHRWRVRRKEGKGNLGGTSNT